MLDVEMADLNKLVELADVLGSDNRLVQGAGGNVSLKNKTSIWVKSSGAWLGDAKKRSIFIRLNLSLARDTLAAGNDDFSTAVEDYNGLRPSIETSLHVMMPQPVVVHVHSINTISWVVRRGGKGAVAGKLEGLQWGWVDYVRPGLPLTQVAAEVLSNAPKTSVLLLGNHGLVVAADTSQKAQELLYEVERRLSPSSTESPVDPADSLILLELLPPGCRLPTNKLIHRLAQSQEWFQFLDGALYPDHVVFLGSKISAVSGSNQEALVDALNTPPYCVAVIGEGVILGKNCSEGSEAMLECLALLAPHLPDRECLRFLTLEEIDELSNWDAEKARLQTK